MPQARTLEDKVSDAVKAYSVFREELTPPQVRGLITAMTNVSLKEDAKPEEVTAYASLVQSSMGLARLVSANDRAALIAAVMATQSGVSRPIISTDEES